MPFALPPLAHILQTQLRTAQQQGRSISWFDGRAMVPVKCSTETSVEYSTRQTIRIVLAYFCFGDCMTSDQWVQLPFRSFVVHMHVLQPGRSSHATRDPLQLAGIGAHVGVQPSPPPSPGATCASAVPSVSKSASLTAGWTIAPTSKRTPSISSFFMTVACEI